VGGVVCVLFGVAGIVEIKRKFVNCAFLVYYASRSGNPSPTFRDRWVVLKCNNPGNRASHLLRGGKLKSPTNLILSEFSASNDNVDVHFKFGRLLNSVFN